MIATPMAAVMLVSRDSAPSRRIAATWRLCAGLACRARAMGFRVRIHPDAYMKNVEFRLRIR